MTPKSLQTFEGEAAIMTLMTRRFQFKLTTLLAATAIVAVSVHWWALRQRAIMARQHFQDVRARGAGRQTRDAIVEEREAIGRRLGLPSD